MIFIFIFLFTFNVFAFNEEEKKEKLSLKAEKIDFVNNQEGKREIKASGNVEVDYTNYNLHSNYLLINEKDDTLKAKDGVVLIEKYGGAVFKTKEVTSNKALTKASIDPFYFERQKLFGEGSGGVKNDDVITLENFTISSCKQDKNAQNKPYWKMKSKTAKYNTKDKNIKLENIIVYAKDVPLLWIPYYNINPNATHGFLSPTLSSGSGTYGIATPYFVTEQTKTHYFLFTPEFLYEVNKAPYSKVNNYRAEYTFTKNNHNFYTDFKIAPNSYTQNDVNGNLENNQQNRYSLFTSYSYSYNNGLFGLNYNKVSDRFFQKNYSGIYNNYLTNNIFLNHSFEGGDSFIKLERAEFIPLASQKTKFLPKIDGYVNYQKYWKKTNLIEFYTNPNLLSISREEGVNQSRFSNSLGINYKLYDDVIKTKINVDIRTDFYTKNYNYIKDGTVKDNYTLVRAVPSLFIENKVPLYFTSNEGNYLLNFTPKLNVKVEAESVNTNKISNQDSSQLFITSNNIFTKDITYGYDYIEEGTHIIYGSDFFLLHKRSKSRFDIFLGQKLQTFLTKKEEVRYSSYVAKAKLTLAEHIMIETDLSINTNNKIEYAKSDLSWQLWRFNFGFSNLFIDKKLNNASLDTNTNTYKLGFKIPNSNFSINTSVVQNMNFSDAKGNISAKFVESNIWLGMQNDCLTFNIGAKKLAYTNTDLEKGYQFYANIKLLNFN